MNKQQLEEKMMAVYAEDVDVGPGISVSPEAVKEYVQVAEQYAYEYAERVIGDGELHVSHVCPQDSIPCREFGARGRLRNAQHTRNKELSSHKEERGI
ncbi:hypothetical protein ACWFRF_15605 [Nocardia sp. NPDC055165]